MTTSLAFTELLAAGGLDASHEAAGAPGDPLADGTFRDGRYWALYLDDDSAPFPGGDQEMPDRLYVQLHEAETSDPLGFLAGCTAEDAADAIHRAGGDGDYAAFTPYEAKLSAVPQPAVAGETTRR